MVPRARPAYIALVFDFDDTLVPDSTTALLEAHGLDTNAFWNTRAKELVTSGYDPTHAYLRLILDEVGEGRALGHLSNRDLSAFGRQMDDRFFTGLPEMFDDLLAVVGDHRDINLEFFIISGGLKPIIEGSAIVQRYFAGVYACELDEVGGVIRHIKRTVTFTEKTRYLFEISKGIEPHESLENAYVVNRLVPERRIPMDQIIYVGDGLTDIPCFSLLKTQGGSAFGVFDPGKESSAKRALVEFLKPDRVISMHAPRFGPTDELGAILRAAVSNLCTTIQLRRSQPEP